MLLRTPIYVTFILLGLLASPAQSQTLPTDCQPGGNRDCALKMPSPYKFNLFTCGNNSRQPSEGAAMAAFNAQMNFSCVVSVTTDPWTPAGQQSGPFGIPCNGSGWYSTPGDYFGEESSNVIVAEYVGTLSNSTNCP